MSGFYSEEYHDLVAAQRVLSGLLKPEIKPSDGAQVSRALVDLIRLKRDMRGIPDPKPVDVAKPQRVHREPKNVVPVEMPAEPPAQSQSPSHG